MLLRHFTFFLFFHADILHFRAHLKSHFELAPTIVNTAMGILYICRFRIYFLIHGVAYSKTSILTYSYGILKKCICEIRKPGCI